MATAAERTGVLTRYTQTHTHIDMCVGSVCALYGITCVACAHVYIPTQMVFAALHLSTSLYVCQSVSSSLCLCVCLSVCVCVCVCVCVTRLLHRPLPLHLPVCCRTGLCARNRYADTHTHTHTHTLVQTHTHTLTQRDREPRLRLCVPISSYIRSGVCVRVCVCVCPCVCVCACACVHTGCRVLCIAGQGPGGRCQTSG